MLVRNEWLLNSRGISFGPLLSDQSQIVWRAPNFLLPPSGCSVCRTKFPVINVPTRYCVFWQSVWVREWSAVLFVLSDFNADHELWNETMQRIQIRREFFSSRLCFVGSTSEEFSPMFGTISGLTTSFIRWKEPMVGADSRFYLTIVARNIVKKFPPSLVLQCPPDSWLPRKRNQQSASLPAVFWDRTERSFCATNLKDLLRKGSRNRWLFCIHLLNNCCSWIGRAPRCSPSALWGRNG